MSDHFDLTERPRRLRRNETVRSLVRENRLSADDLIWPLFSGAQIKGSEEISAMPGVFRWGLDDLLRQCENALNMGLRAVALFEVCPHKDAKGSAALDPKGFIPKALQTLKKEFPNLVVISDIALDPYTDHGHDGLVQDGRVLNDPTLTVLSEMALLHAQSGADFVAPSDMMDGRVGVIRKKLDRAGLADTGIIAYSAKYASGFYGPFREALSSAPKKGDKKTYQMDPANSDEALREVALDLAEGADIVMVKPALAYLDIIWRVKEKFQRPVAAYNVSGEYSLVKAAAKNGWIDERKVVEETLLSMKRAGSDMIFTYHAMEVAGWLKNS
jgi:porphobilinogen synthase